MKRQLTALRVISMVLFIALAVCIILLILHRHTMVHIPASQPTCTEGGNAEYWYCAGCEKYFSDGDGKKETDPASAAIAAAGHAWGGWSAVGSVHGRACTVCEASEYGEHAYSGGTCTVCGQQESGAGESLFIGEAKISAVNDKGCDYAFASEGDMYASANGMAGVTSVYPGEACETVFGISFTAQRQVSLSVSIEEEVQDIYLALENAAGTRIEYHPVRFTLSLWQGGEWAVVEGCADRTLREMQEAFAASSALNKTVPEGESVELSFKLRWEWAEYIEEPDSFAIRGEDGAVYSFADSASDSSKWYLSMLDTALGEASAKVPSGTVKDVSGNEWTLTGEYAEDLSFRVGIAVRQG